MSRTVLLAVVALLTVGLAACEGTEEPTIADEDLGATPAEVEDDDGTSADDADDADDGTEAADDDGADAASADDGTASEDEGSSAPTFEDTCAGRDDEAFIEVLTPQDGATVSDPIEVTGCGNTFEANYQYRVEDADGAVVADGFGTMSCGNGCVGEFSEEITVGVTGDVTLVVFETSAEDGSEQHVVEVALTLE